MLLLVIGSTGAGTYTITGTGIDPTNSGSADNLITFSGYQDEVVTVTGDATIAGVSSGGVRLSSDSYIKVTKIIFSNMKRGFQIHAGGYNEISYCTFTFRDHYGDIYLSGTLLFEKRSLFNAVFSASTGTIISFCK